MTHSPPIFIPIGCQPSVHHASVAWLCSGWLAANDNSGYFRLFHYNTTYIVEKKHKAHLLLAIWLLSVSVYPSSDTIGCQAAVTNLFVTAS